MTLQYPEDPKIERLLNMTNHLVSNITQQLKEAY